MSADIVKGTPVSLTAAELRAILNTLLEDPNAELQFIITPSDKLVSIELELWVGGVETVHSVQLNSDGTWQAKSWVQA